MRSELFAGLALAGCLAASSPHARQHTPPPDKPGAQHMPHRFEDAERYARQFDDPARDAWQMPLRVIEALALAPGQLVADIGAGTGYFTVRLARASAAAGKVYAVDIEPSMVEYVRQRAAREGLSNVVAVQATPERANLPEPVDVALIVDTYHHIPSRETYFRELRRSLKPGGRLAIVDFRKDAPEGPPKEFRFTPEQIASELAQAGFRLHATHDFLPRQIFLVFTAAPSDEPFLGTWTGTWDGAGSGGFVLTLDKGANGALSGTVSVTGEPTYDATLAAVSFDGGKLSAKYDFPPDERAEVILSASFDGHTATGTWSLRDKASASAVAGGGWTVSRK